MFDNGYEVTSGFSESSDTVRDYYSYMKSVVDDYKEHPEDSIHYDKLLNQNLKTLLSFMEQDVNYQWMKEKSRDSVQITLLSASNRPKNLWLSADDVDERVRDAMKFVGLDYDTYAERSPFHLSGGQMRRVAIAGVVAMDPDFLVLDEPSAGLDPFGREEIFEEIIRLHKEKGITVILVSHNMEDISRMASRLVVLDKGRIVLDGQPMDIFNHHRDALQAVGVDIPPVSVTMEYLREQGLDVSNCVLSVDDAVQAILEGGSHVK